MDGRRARTGMLSTQRGAPRLILQGCNGLVCAYLSFFKGSHLCSSDLESLLYPAGVQSILFFFGGGLSQSEQALQNPVNEVIFRKEQNNNVDKPQLLTPC